MRKNIAFIILIIGAIYSLKAQTQTQDLNMGLHQLQFPSANGGFNRIHSFGGTFPGKWLFKSRFDHIYLDAGENENNKYSILFLSGGIERAKLNGAGNFGIGTSNPVEKLHVEGSLLLDAYQLGNQKGLFFREGFSATNKYNLSILTYDDGDNSPDGLDINAYDGIYFNTGSNSRNPRMTVQGNGNVGIGTTNPEEKLQIGNAYTFHDGGHKVIGFLYKPSGAVDLDATKYSSEIRFDPTHGNFFLGTSSTITEAPTARLSINKNGYVGIGTTSPSARLEIKSSGDGAEILKLSTERPWVFKQEGTGASSNLVLQEISGNKFFKIKSYDNTDIYTIQSNSGDTYFKGNMGIGTNNTQGYKLGVKGKIAAEEVKVALYNGWPDYVFEEDYHLPTLQAVEQHISENGHLENIPSATEVAENGIQLGEMNKKLLEKIEQLTLYMIEQNKKTEQLIKKSEMLQEEINLLKQQVKR
ncbi:tail fiber protein [uncultured Aquimarina sp.]|uniref:tail fiber protein n=1 Tax=uncultured Aquimarina sp. TaxID=575652 RepID=UPI002622E7AF|nr:tail fiber protein [uncultured Aquimarina sp.]